MDEILSILCDANAILDSYFENERDEAIRRIEQDGRRDLIEYDEDGRFNAFRSEAFENYDIRDKETTSDLDALEDAFQSYFNPSDIDVENVKEFEYFGCLALSLLDDFVRTRDFRYDFKKGEYDKKKADEVSSQDQLRLANILLEALDCVSRGETKKARLKISESYEQKIEQIKNEKQSEVEKAHIAAIAASVKDEMLATEAARRKEEAAARNNARHEKNRSVKTKVLQWYAAEYKDFPSAAKAAKIFCQRLSGEGTEREQRTVEGWIRAFAKANDIRLRP